MKALDFGLPQIRERIYIVGFNKKYFKECVNFCFPQSLQKNTKVGDILQSHVDDKYTISNRLWKSHQLRKKHNQQMGKGFGYSLVTPDTPYAHTLSARYYKDGSEILLKQQNKNPRKLTPRECARLQGFPDNFIFPVSDIQAYKQLGNSVAIPVIYAIAQKIMIAI